MATQIVVNGTLEKPDGTADAGTVEAKLSTELYDTAGDLVASRTPVTDTLDADGDWSLTLYATNDTDTTPTGAFYYFTFTPTTGGRGEHVRFELDKATTPVRFEDLAEPAANAPSLLGSYVETGADLDTLSSGDATDGQVPTADGNGAVVWEDQTGSGGGGGVDTSGTPVATDYARFTDADTVEGRSPAEVRSDINVADGATDDTTVDAHIADGTDAHDASAVSVADTAGHFTGTQTEAVLAEIQTNIDNLPEVATSDPAKVPVSTVGGVTTFDVDGLANKALAINNQTGTAYTPVASDAEALVQLDNANPITVTLPEGVFALGESVTFEQLGAGQVSFAAGANVVVQSEPIFDDATRGQYAVVRAILVNDDLLGVGGDVWLLVGGLAAASPAQVQRAAASGGAVTLGAAPQLGNTMLLVVKAQDVAAANIDTPAGWTELESAESAGGGTDHAWKLFGKPSDGTETTSPTPTFNGGTPAVERTEYQEWSGLVDIDVLVDGVNTLVYEGTVVTETTWDPAAVTPANNKVAFLCLLSTSGGGTGAITSDWANLDDTYNHTTLAAGHAVVSDGAALDTDISWTNQRVVTGAVIVLNGRVP